jgi:ABC-type glycerol-3-phosphate transport system substrate-binding protein
MRKGFVYLLAAAMLVGGVLGLSGQGKQIVLDVRASQPEYMAKERQIWDMFEAKNPDIKINLFSVNESEEAAFNARIAAGNPPAINLHAYAQSIAQSENLVDLKTIDFKYWDKFTYDAKSAWKNQYGVDKVPILQYAAGPLASFIYYKDEMAKAKLDPTTIKTMADLDSFLAKLKKYVDGRSDLKYVIAAGWHSWCWPYQFMSHFITAFDPQAQAKLAKIMSGKAKWTDLANNPYVPAFKKLKEWYDKGYLPKEFWTLAWENDFEASVIGRKAILTFHGPWLWDKIEAADPTAQLGGFPIPANSAGKIQAFPPDVSQGPGIYKDALKDPDRAKATIRAWNFFFSPEAMKPLVESLGQVPVYDLSSLGGANLKASQYLTVIKPVLDGKYGKVKWDYTSFGADAGSPYYIDGRQSPVNSDALAEFWGGYFSGKTDMAGLMSSLQKMYDDAFKVK